MNKYLYLVIIILLHIGWLFWLINNNLWHRNIQMDIENLSPGTLAYVPIMYKVSKALFYLYSIGVVLVHGLFISKSNDKPLTKLIIEAISILLLPVVIVIFLFF